VGETVVNAGRVPHARTASLWRLSFCAQVNGRLLVPAAVVAALANGACVLGCGVHPCLGHVPVGLGRGVGCCTPCVLDGLKFRRECVVCVWEGGGRRATPFPPLIGQKPQ
jgi:hypothetical protein